MSALYIAAGLFVVGFIAVLIIAWAANTDAESDAHSASKFLPDEGE